MSMRAPVPDYIKRLTPYKAGKPIDELARERGLSRIVKLASNENPFGPSPRAVAALERAAGTLHRYVDPAAPQLVDAIAEFHAIDQSRIVTGAGTDALLANIITAFSAPGDEVLTSQGTFIGIYVNASKLGRKLVTVRLTEYRFDLEALIDAITNRTRIIFIANPNNPTGTMVTGEALERFLQRVPPDVIVILDEAYFAYAIEHAGYPDGLSLSYPNLIVTRTLSKAYGLAGLRVGYAIADPELTKYLYRVKLPFEPNSYAQIAGAAALADTTFVERTVAQNRRSLLLMKETFSELGITQIPSVANFILLLLPDESFAAEFFRAALSRGLIVRHVDTFGIPNGIRINSGTDEETAFAIDIIRDVYPDLLNRFSDAGDMLARK